MGSGSLFRYKTSTEYSALVVRTRRVHGSGFGGFPAKHNVNRDSPITRHAAR